MAKKKSITKEDETRIRTMIQAIMAQVEDTCLSLSGDGAHKFLDDLVEEIQDRKGK